MSLFKYKSEFKEEFSLSSVIKIFKLHKLFIILFVTISVIGTIIYSYIIPEIYISETTLIPPDDAATGGGLTSFLQSLSGGISFGGIGQPNKIQLFQEFLKSREVAKIITDTLKLKNNPKFSKLTDEALYNVVGSMIDVVVKRTGIIIISASTGTSYFPVKSEKTEAAKFAAEIANSAVIALDKLNREKSTSRSHKKRLYIEKVLAQKTVELDSIDNKMEAFRKNNKVLSLDDQSRSVLSTAINISSELVKTEIDYNLKLQEFDVNSPAAKLYKEKINNLKNQYQKSQKGGVGSIDEYSIPLNSVPALIREYANLVRAQKVLEQVKLYLETQRYQESIQEESDVPTVEVLDKALPPVRRFSPDRKMMILLAIFISGLFSLSIVTGYALRKGMIYLKNENNTNKV